MSKIYCIGECGLDIVFKDNAPSGTMPGGRVVNAAWIMARNGSDVCMLSEASADNVGDIIVDYLDKAGVDTKYIDRFTEGVSPTTLFFPDPESHTEKVVRYERDPELRFDIAWPKIEEGDIMLFGGFYAIDATMRHRLLQLLKHAAERNAILVYLPGFLPQQAPRITRVMPAILENLEMANVVITRNKDLQTIFGIDEAQQCYHDHITFYCRALINIDSECSRIDYYAGGEVTSASIPAGATHSLIWNAGIVAGVSQAIADKAMTPAAIDTPADNLRRDILSSAVETANNAFADLLLDWQRNH